MKDEQALRFAAQFEAEQQREQRIRNAAPQLLKALENLYHAALHRMQRDNSCEVCFRYSPTTGPIRHASDCPVKEAELVIAKARGEEAEDE